MKILLMNDFAEKAGGAELYFYNLKDLLEEKGHQVETYFSEKSSKLKVFASIFNLKDMIKSYQKIKKFNPDIVHLHKYNLSLSPSPLIAAKLLRKKTVITFHDFGILCCNGWCVDKNGNPCKDPTSIKWLFKKSLSNKKFINKLYDYIKNRIHLFFIKLFADICIGPSKVMTKYLKKLFLKKQIEHISYFIEDKWEFKPKKKLGKKLLFIGRIEKEKGLKYLLKSLQNLDISLDIIGEGKEKAHLEKLTKKLKISNKITFCGKVAHSDTQKYYQQADVLVVPSIWMEQFGIVGIEACACGTPAIGTNLGGIKDWLKNNENGYFIKPRNPEDIINKVNKIENIKKFSKNARKVFEGNFTKEKHYKKIMKRAYKMNERNIDIEKKNKSDYIKWYSSKNSSDIYTNFRDIQETVKLARKYLGNIKGKKVLDVGFGLGNLLNIFRKEKAICYGIENNKKAIELLKEKQFFLKYASAYNLPYEDNSFDLTVSTMVLEHLKDDMKALKEMERVTINKGYIIIVVPSTEWDPKEHELHHRHYNPTFRHKVQQKTNLYNLEYKYYKTFYDSIINSFINFRLTKNIILPIALKLSFIDKLFSGITKGKSIIFVFKKNFPLL